LLLRKYPDNALVPDFERLIEVFDRKPLLEVCYRCGHQATCASVARGTGRACTSGAGFATRTAPGARSGS
jgi:hypothetical protein